MNIRPCDKYIYQGRAQGWSSKGLGRQKDQSYQVYMNAYVLVLLSVNDFELSESDKSRCFK